MTLAPSSRIRLAAAAALATLAMMTPAFAQIGALFYERFAETWYIFGDLGDRDVNPACGLRYSYNDGSSFTLYKDLVTGEVFIVVVNMVWDVRDVREGDRFNANFNFYTGNGALYDSFTGYITFYSKNSIIIPDVGGDAFLAALYGAASLTIVMPGNVENAHVTLRGSAQGMNYLSECIDAAARLNRNQPSPAPPAAPQVPRNIITL